MGKFTFKKTKEKPQLPLFAEDGVHAAAITQVADVGLQLPFDRDKEPEAQMAVAFELAGGDLIAKRMRFSEHPSSSCYALLTAAFPGLHESSDQELGLADLLGKTVLIEVEVRDGKWPRVIEIMPLKEGFEAFGPKGELLNFDAEEMDREVYRKLHRDIRSWVFQAGPPRLTKRGGRVSLPGHPESTRITDMSDRYFTTRRARVNKQLLLHAETVLAEWLDGEIQGEEFVAINPLRDDSNTGSFKINLKTGVWKDFAIDDFAGADLVSLYAALHELDESDALDALEKQLADSGVKHTPPADKTPRRQAPRRPNVNPRQPPRTATCRRTSIPTWVPRP